MSTTSIKDLPPRLRDRYGYRPTPRWLIALAAVVCMAIAVLGGLVAYQKANPDVRYKLIAFNIVDAQHAEVTFQIQRNALQPVECVVRAQNKEHHDVGYAIVTVPPGGDDIQLTYHLATRAQAVMAEVLACAKPGELHAPVAAFPPGTSNPPQPWRPQ